MHTLTDSQLEAELIDHDIAIDRAAAKHLSIKVRLALLNTMSDLRGEHVRRFGLDWPGRRTRSAF